MIEEKLIIIAQHSILRRILIVSIPVCVFCIASSNGVNHIVLTMFRGLGVNMSRNPDSVNQMDRSEFILIG